MSLNETHLLLTAAQAELNHHAALRKLRSALHGALAEGSQRAAQVLAARILAETAVTEMSPRARRAAWLRAIDLLEACIAKDPSSSDAVGHYADVVVDASQDLYSDIHEPILRHHLAKARRRLQEWARTEHELLPAQKAYLLTRLSVVRRAQALSQLGFKERRTPLVEARNVASRALSIQSQNPMAQLELANCQWALLRYAETDAEYALQLGDVEVAFRAASASDESELVGLSLSRFFRLTHQSSRACDEFERVSENAQHRRRLLRESHVFAEAVQHLWYTGYPDIHVKPLLDRATQTLATAIDSGCHYARHIVDLATLHAMSGDLSLADTILTRDLITKDQRFDWNSLAKAITSPSLLDATKTDLAGLGFALGLNSPIILNKLGTYCRDFLDDRKLALTFYNASLRLDSRSSIALTNKARLLLDLGDAKDFKEVRALLDRARSYADRRYTWWRHELNRLITARDGALMPPDPVVAPEGALVSFRKRRLAFCRIEAMTNPNERGLEFERFISHLIAVSFTEYDGSHRSPGAQNDAFFIHRQTPFRVETKWTSPPAQAPTLREFSSRIELAGMGGCFISISGFSDAAVDYCRSIIRQRCLLLVDGEDIRSVVEGDMSFLDLIDFKYISFFKKENPYAKLKRRASI